MASSIIVEFHTRYSERAYAEYQDRFHSRLTAINSEENYDSDAAAIARQALVERHRRIASTHPSELAYDEFLDSIYWISLSDWLKYKANYHCQSCGKRPKVNRGPQGRGLNIHHKTYAHRGFEYPDHLDDLEVLCRRCHSRKHGIKEPHNVQAAQ